MSLRIVVPILMLTVIGCEKPKLQPSAVHLKTDHKSQLDPLPSLDDPQLAKPGGSVVAKATDSFPDDQPSLDEMLLFFPTKYPGGNWNPQALVYEDVWMAANDGTRIHGWYCPQENPRAHILFAHGNAGNLSHRSEMLSYFQNELRVSTLIFDYRGYGRSEGRPTVSGAISDARAASQMLSKKANVDEAKLVFMGRSLGGAIVIQLAADVQPRGLVIESSFSSLKSVASHHFPRLSWLVPKNKLNSCEMISSYNGYLLQSHGTRDRTIPIELGTRLFEAANAPKRFIKMPNLDHNDPNSPAYYNALSKFIDELPD